MVNWKVVLVVIVIAILAMAVGMWFGYRYVSEQEDISPGGHYEPSDTDVPAPQSAAYASRCSSENSIDVIYLL